VTIPHVADFLQQFESPRLWYVAWALAVAIDVAILRTAYLLRVLTKHKKMLALMALLYFGIASIVGNAGYYVTYGMSVWASGIIGAFIPAAVALLAYIRGAQDDKIAQTPVLPTVSAVTVKHVDTKQVTIRGAKRNEVLTLIRNNPQIRVAEIVKLTGVPIRTVYRYLEEGRSDKV
jgi:hypothetical protein